VELEAQETVAGHYSKRLRSEAEAISEEATKEQRKQGRAGCGTLRPTPSRK